MSWFKKFIGDARRPGDLSDNDRATIRQDLAPLDKIRPGLAEETARYVIDGESSAVMLFLTQEKKRGSEDLSSLAPRTSAPLIATGAIGSATKNEKRGQKTYRALPPGHLPP